MDAEDNMEEEIMIKEILMQQLLKESAEDWGTLKKWAVRFEIASPKSTKRKRGVM